MGPLRHRGFRLLLTGQLASVLGDAVYSVALAWYVLAGHGGPLLLGTVLAAYGVPRTVLLLAGGHASDRWRPWTVMMVADGVRAVGVAALAAVAALGPARPPLLIATAVVLGAAGGIFLPGSFAIVPALLPVEERQQGNALAAGTAQLSSLAGPALGGIVVAVAGASTGFAIDAVSFVISAITLAGVRRRTQAAPGAPPAAASPADAGDRPTTLRGLLAREPILMLMLVTDAITNLGSTGMARVALPALTRATFHGGAEGYGALLGAMGAGLLLGTIAGAIVPQVKRPLLSSSLALLAAVPLIALLPYLGGPIPAGAALLVSAVLEAFGNILITTAYQRWAPPALIGRVTGLLLLASMGMLPVSVLLAGVLVHVAGPAVYFPLSAGSVLIAATVQLASRTWRDFGAAGPGFIPGAAAAGSGWRRRAGRC